MLFNGYKYLINTKRLETTYYQCSTYRTTQCKGKLIVKELSPGETEVRETGEHTCKSAPITTMRDCVEEMRLTLEKEAIASSTVIPGRLWDRVSRELDAKYKGQAVRVMTRDAAINLIKYVRKQVHGGDEFRVIESAPTVCVSESDERSFVHFNVFYDNNGKRQRIIGMGHPDLLRLLMYTGVSLFVDATFSITPKPFQQTMIVMGHDSAFDVYIPVLYILTEAKDEWTYWHCLHWVRVLGKMKMSPRSITCDFEAAFINAVRDQFEGTPVVGCLFHWKQAIRRKLVDLRIPANQIDEAMSPGIMDILTVIPIDEIRTKGIPFIMSKLDTRGTVRLWSDFWSYFTRTWMKMFPPELWNVNSYVTKEEEMQNRTNNPIESYNRRVKQALGTHPSLPVFVEKVKEEAQRYLHMLDDIAMHRRVAPPHADPVTLNVPDEYTAFGPKRPRSKK